MSSQIIQLGAGDFDEAMRFLNAVFGEYRPHDFAGMLPARYQPTDRHMSCNYAVQDGGRLSAIVGVFPIHWCVGGVTLKVASVGGVATTALGLSLVVRINEAYGTVEEDEIKDESL